MQRYKYVILGAGPAGLAFAATLKQAGETSFIVLEKEEEAGGLCRSTDVDGSPFDIGGGHFLDVRRQKVNQFLFSFMPKEEWNLFERDSRIDLNGVMIHHPIEANIWEMELPKQVEYLTSIAKAGCNMGQEKPAHFVEWIRWKLGEAIAQNYMLPYNRKMFADELNELGTYWLDKLPDVSFEETLLSCLTKKPYGKQPGHASFYYPKQYGYGEVWLRMAKYLDTNLVLNTTIEKLDCENRIVETQNGKCYQGEVIVTTIPWTSFSCITGMEECLLRDIGKLKTSAIETRYVPRNLDTKAQWIYLPDEDEPAHRILVRHNFCPNSKGYWLETRKERVPFLTENGYHYLNEYAYPLNTIDKPEIMERLLTFCQGKKIYGLGRWGEHSHFNSDVTVERAMLLAEKLI